MDVIVTKTKKIRWVGFGLINKLIAADYRDFMKKTSTYGRELFQVQGSVAKVKFVKQSCERIFFDLVAEGQKFKDERKPTVT